MAILFVMTVHQVDDESEAITGPLSCTARSRGCHMVLRSRLQLPITSASLQASTALAGLSANAA